MYIFIVLFLIINGTNFIVRMAPATALLCDVDSVSRGDIVVSLDDMSLSGGGDAVVSSVDESVCGVSSVLAAGVLDRCGVDIL